MQSIEELLTKYDREETANLQRRSATAISRHVQALNRQTSPLLKLPTELILEIGNLVLGVRGNELQREEIGKIDHWCVALGEPVWGKRWFAQVLPFLQTCIQLRNQLHDLRFESAPLKVDFSLYRGKEGITGLWRCCVNELAKWPEDGPHKGTKTLHVYAPFDVSFKDLNRAAASAGGLECMIYGQLRNPPVLYWSCVALDPVWDDDTIRECLTEADFFCLNEFEVNHSR